MQDVTSPLYVLMAAAAVNFLGDVVLVPRSGALGGAAGAAWATVASQYAALLFFGRWMTAKEKGADPAMHHVDTATTGGKHDGSADAGARRSFSFWKNQTKEKTRPAKKNPKSRGFLSTSNLSLKSYLSPANLNLPKAKQFLPFVIPVTTTSVGRISGYIAMSHVASSTLGTHDMAGHQIIFSIFCCLTPFVDALGQVAQSFVPAVFEAKEKSLERALTLRETVRNFRKVGIGFGAVLVGLVACIPLIGRYFTTDPVVLERVNSALPGVGLFLAVHGLVCANEGTLLGQKDLKFLRNMYAIFFFAVPGYMLRLKHRALTGVQTVGIGTMWAAFSTYNLIRTSTWFLRLAQLQRRTGGGGLLVLWTMAGRERMMLEYDQQYCDCVLLVAHLHRIVKAVKWTREPQRERTIN